MTWFPPKKYKFLIPIFVTPSDDFAAWYRSSHRVTYSSSSSGKSFTSGYGGLPLKFKHFSFQIKKFPNLFGNSLSAHPSSNLSSEICL